MAINRSLFYKELSKKDSDGKVQDLLKQRIAFQAKYHFRPGHLIFTSYNAKHKEFTYDKTPLALILKRGKTHTLVLNFHWIPVSMRIYLIKHILKLNKKNIEQNKPLDLDYGQ